MEEQEITEGRADSIKDLYDEALKKKDNSSTKIRRNGSENLKKAIKNE